MRGGAIGGGEVGMGSFCYDIDKSRHLFNHLLERKKTSLYDLCLNNIVLTSPILSFIQLALFEVCCIIRLGD